MAPSSLFRARKLRRTVHHKSHKRNLLAESFYAFEVSMMPKSEKLSSSVAADLITVPLGDLQA